MPVVLGKVCHSNRSERELAPQKTSPLLTLPKDNLGFVNITSKNSQLKYLIYKNCYHIPSYFYEILCGNVNVCVLTYICGMTVGHVFNSVAMLSLTPNDKFC